MPRKVRELVTDERFEGLEPPMSLVRAKLSFTEPEDKGDFAELIVETDRGVFRFVCELHEKPQHPEGPWCDREFELTPMVETACEYEALPGEPELED